MRQLFTVVVLALSAIVLTSCAVTNPFGSHATPIRSDHTIEELCDYPQNFFRNDLAVVGDFYTEPFTTSPDREIDSYASCFLRGPDSFWARVAIGGLGSDAADAADSTAVKVGDDTVWLSSYEWSPFFVTTGTTWTAELKLKLPHKPGARFDEHLSDGQIHAAAQMLVDLVRDLKGPDRKS